jgi:hypothetical protein
MSETIQTAGEPHAYSVAMLASRWHRSSGNIYSMIRRGELKAFRVGNLVRILASEIARVEGEFSELRPQPETSGNDLEATSGQEVSVPASPSTQFYTVREAARTLRISSSTLASKLAELWHTRPDDPLHARAGKKIIISAADLRLIYEALKERPHTVRWGKAESPRSEAAMFKRLAELTDPRRNRTKPRK